MPPAKLETLRTVRRGAELFHRSPVGPSRAVLFCRPTCIRRGWAV